MQMTSEDHTEPSLVKRFLNRRTLTAVVLIVVAVVMFSGRVQYEAADDGFTVRCGSTKTEVVYSDIESVTLITALEIGVRSFGMSTFQVDSGTYSNTAYGSYLLLAEKSQKVCYVEVKTKSGDVVVFNQKTEEDTRSAYEQIKSHIQ